MIEKPDYTTQDDIFYIPKICTCTHEFVEHELSKFIGKQFCLRCHCPKYDSKYIYKPVTKVNNDT